MRNFHRLGALVAVCDSSPDTADTMAAEYGVKALGVDDILADDGVVIAAPAQYPCRLKNQLAAPIQEGWAGQPGVLHILIESKPHSSFLFKHDRL